MSRICPGGLLSPSYIIKKIFFLRDEPSVSFLLLTACSLYLSEEKNKLKQNRQGSENALWFVNNFSPPVACQSTAGQAIIFPPKINACVLCVRVLCKTRRSFIRSFFVLAKTRLILDEMCRLYGKFSSYFPRINGPNDDDDYNICLQRNKFSLPTITRL